MVRQSITIDGQRLYHVDVANSGAELDLRPVLEALDGSVMTATRSTSGWHCRVAFPSQDAVSQFIDIIESAEIEFEVNRRYELREFGEHNDYGLSGLQRETLLAALDTGHFDIPRQSTKADLSDKLDISDNAVSQRMRRGMKTLLKNTLKTDRFS